MRILPALLLISALLAGCGGGSAGSTNVLPPIGSLGPAYALETPISAASFGDSVGVNLHMTYVVGAYNTGFATWGPILAQSGIKHVRDGICPTFVAIQWCQQTLAPRMGMLAGSGIKFDLLTSMNDPFSYVSSYAAALSIAPDIEAYEGPNECDVSGQCVADWNTVEAAWQEQLYTLVKPGITIIAPSMVTASGYASLGNLAQYATVGNIHDFAAAYMPESQIGAAEHLQWVQAMTGNDPVWSTENGYNTDPTFANNGVPQVVQERYLPRMLLEHLRLGVRRTYIYQLFDFGPDGGSNMGLLNADYTPKPAWNALLQMLKLFADSAAAPCTPLSLNMAGDTSGTLDHVLFQRSDGTYLLALWLAKPAYDPGTHTVLGLASEVLTVALPGTVTSATATSFGDDGTVSTATLSGQSGSFQVPVRSAVSVLAFRP